MGIDKSSIWGQVAGTAANTALGTIFGQIFAGAQDRRQIRQGSKLQELELQGQQRLLDMQAQKELEMWMKTGPAGQVEQYKKAGLNPALMYGMSGGGGQTVGGSAGHIGTQQVSSGEMAQGMGMAMQMQLLKAQKENIEADTAVKVAEAQNKPLVGENLRAQTGNVIVDTELKKVNTTIAGLESKYLGESLSDRLQKISGEAVQAIQAGQQAVNNTSISDKTRLDTIKRLKAEAIGSILRNALTSAQTANTQAGTINTQADTRLKGQEYEQNIQRLMIEWRELSVREREHELKRMLGIGQDDPVNQTMKMITEAVDGIIMFRRGMEPQKQHTPVKGFGGR